MNVEDRLGQLLLSHADEVARVKEGPVVSFSCMGTACPFACPFSLRGRQLFTLSEASE